MHIPHAPLYTCTFVAWYRYTHPRFNRPPHPPTPSLFQLFLSNFSFNTTISSLNTINPFNKIPLNTIRLYTIYPLNTIPGVHGRVVNLTKVTQDRFRLAITLLMGRHMDSVIVDTEETAKGCIAHLKRARYAPLTFIPLDSVMVKPLDERLRRIHGAQLAIDVLQYDRALERAFVFICGYVLGGVVDVGW